MELGIGKVARLFGITTKTIRFYEERGLVAPARAENGYRRFRPAHIRQILRIRQLQALGLSLEQIGDILENEADAERWQAILQTILADVDGQLEALAARRQRIAALLAGEDVVAAVATQPLQIPELAAVAHYLERHLPAMSRQSLRREQTQLALLQPAGDLVAALFRQATPTRQVGPT